MDVNTLVDVYVSTGQKIDTLWNFFVTVHLGIAGFILVTESRNVHWITVVWLFFGYACFSGINFHAKEIEYSLLNAATTDLSVLDLAYPNVDQFFEGIDFLDRSLRNIVIHIFSCLAIIFVSVFSEHKLILRKDSN